MADEQRNSKAPLQGLIPEIHGQRTSENDAFLQHPGPSISSSSNHEIKDGATKEQPSTGLHWSPFVLILVFLYSALVVFAWAVTCILTFRPITGECYGDSRIFEALVANGSDFRPQALRCMGGGSLVRNLRRKRAGAQ